MKNILFIAMAMAGVLLSCNSMQGHDESAKTNSKPELTQTESFSLRALDSIGSNGILNKENESDLSAQKAHPPFQDHGKGQSRPVPTDWEKKIIRNADLSLEVKDFRQAGSSINEVIRLSGGYIASSTQQQLDDQLRNEMTIRVPREKFDLLVEQLSAYANTILQKNITSQDVTEEYVDTKSRITTKEKMLARYYDFLQQAKKIDEVLEVQDHINDIQEGIDQATGRVNYINHQSVLSTIHLLFFQKIAPVKGPGDSPRFTSLFAQNLNEGWRLMQSILLFLIRFWPLYLFGFIAWWMIRRNKKTVPLPTAHAHPAKK
jgi:hypothetical protein